MHHSAANNTMGGVMKLLQKSLGATAGIIALMFSLSAQADTTLDLTTTGATGVINTGTYTQVPPQPTGSGVLGSFVRISDNASLIQAYNTTVNNVYQNDSSNTFNHAVTVGQIGFTTVGTDTFMRFLLDINQTGTNPLISLDEVQIYISTVPDQSIEPVLGQADTLALGTKVYQMDTPTSNNGVLLNFALNSGSGSGDMFLDIPLALFTAAFTAGGADFDTTAEQNGAYIYLYSRFGERAGYGNNDGYEEWSFIRGAPIGGPCVPTPGNPCGGPPQETPEPGTLAILATGLIGLAYFRRRRYN
jgi:hypothetical protein